MVSRNTVSAAAKATNTRRTAAPSPATGDSPVSSTCTASTNSCTCAGWDYTQHVPPGWIRQPTAGPVFWPFPFYNADGTEKFPQGTYVRAVGTLWRDGVHGPGSTGFTDDQYAANGCWNNDSTPNIGTQEMHNVDWMEPITRDPSIPMHTVVSSTHLTLPTIYPV